jgi:endonuclease IV
MAFPSIRTRQVIPYVLQRSVGEKLFPPKTFTEKYPKVTYPGSLKQRYSEFGLALEAILTSRLAVAYGDRFIIVTDDGDFASDEASIFTSFTSLDPDEADKILTKFASKILSSLVSAKDLQTTLDFVESGSRACVKRFVKEFPPREVKSLRYGYEMICSIPRRTGLSGHPDFMVFMKDHVVPIDCKVFYGSTGASRDAKAIKAQISIYAALAREEGLKVKRVGLILPWKRNESPLALYDVEKWDHVPLLNLSVKCTKFVLREPETYAWWETHKAKYNVGNHITKEDALELHDKGKKTRVPFQIFLCGNMGRFCSEEKTIGKMIEDGVNFVMYNAFVHAPYSLNLCQKTFKSGGSVVDVCITYYEAAYALGFKGIVYHVGFHSSEEEGLKRQKKNLETIIKRVGLKKLKRCPILLETPCGNKRVVLSTPRSFSRFIESMPEGIDVCLDTCHVFVAGYGPQEYLEKFKARDRIRLIHFNGSWKPKGVCADAHATLFKPQMIPLSDLEYVLDFSKRNKAFCVVE